VPRDAFRELGIHVHYKTLEYCEAIELFPPANPTFQGKTLIGEPFNALRDWLQSLDESLIVDDTGLTSYRFGFGLYVPYIEENPDESIQSVFVFERGYHDV
jgi:hypothetical protein